MPSELEFTETNIAELLKEWKDEDAIWGTLTHEMRRRLRGLVRISELIDQRIRK